MNESFEDQITAQVELWERAADSDAAWDARRLVTEMSKAGEHDQAIEHGERALRVWSDFEPLSSAVAWALYRRDLAGLTEECNLESRQRAKTAFDRIRQLCEADLYGKYSPFPTSALKFTSVLSKRWPAAAIEILHDMAPDQLSDERQENFPPNRERWYMHMTKSLESIGQWEDLLTVSSQAIVESCIDKKNLGWIRLRHAEALRHTGQGAEAEPIIRAAAKSSGDWWLYARWAQLLKDLGREQEALKAAYRALATGGGTSFGWETQALVGELLKESDPELAAAHVQLSRLFRKEEGWPPKQSLEDLAVEFNVGEAVDESIPKLRKRLKKIWQNVLDDDRETGKVARHINEGSGFIEPDNGGGSLYFARPRNSTQPLPAVGTPVSFERQKSFDKSKNRESERAAKWRTAHE